MGNTSTKRNNCSLKAGSFMAQVISRSDQKRVEKNPWRCSRPRRSSSLPISRVHRSTPCSAGRGARDAESADDPPIPVEARFDDAIRYLKSDPATTHSTPPAGLGRVVAGTRQVGTAHPWSMVACRRFGCAKKRHTHQSPLSED